jgi:hypothetical protein
MNGINYADCRDENTSVVLYGQRAICDAEGNNLPDTYMKNEVFTNHSAKLQNIVGSSVGVGIHNSFFRGKDITDKFRSGDLYEVISKGTFTDIWIGDYFKTKLKSTTVKDTDGNFKIVYGDVDTSDETIAEVSTSYVQEITCRIAGFNTFLRIGDSADLTKNHAVIVPDESIFTYYVSEDKSTVVSSAKMSMNRSNDVTTGGYNGSDMRKYMLTNFAEALASIFSDHLITSRQIFSSGVSTTGTSGGDPSLVGYANADAWVDSTVELMSEWELFGTRIYSSGGLNGRTGAQLPLFNHAPNFIVRDYSYWLRNVASATQFAGIDEHGNSEAALASTTKGIRPRWLID